MSIAIQHPQSLAPPPSLGIYTSPLESATRGHHHNSFAHINGHDHSSPQPSMSAMASGQHPRHPYGYPAPGSARPPQGPYDPIPPGPSQYPPTQAPQPPQSMQRLPMMTPPGPVGGSGLPPTSAPSMSQSPIISQEQGGFLTYSPTTDPQSPSAPFTLTIRQEPDRAKVVMGKDKADRKPVDPPPILQLEVPPQSGHILQSPYHFVMAFLIDEKEDTPVSFQNGNPLFGTQVSSLHKLKDTNNQDGGFFVFGDLSVRVEGRFRLKFILYEVSNAEVLQLGEITSRVFKVFSPRHFPGMEESTFLTRSFSDQGVRLRLRKDSRSMTTRKRSSQVAKFNDQVQDQRYRPRARMDSTPQTYDVPPQQQQQQQQHQQQPPPPPQGNGWWAGHPGPSPHQGGPGSAPGSAGPYGPSSQGHGSPYGHDTGPPPQRYAPA